MGANRPPSSCYLICLLCIFTSVFPFVQKSSFGTCSRSRNFREYDAPAALRIFAAKKKELITTPHSGRHFRPSHPAYRFSRWRLRRKRFMEGWYYRLTIPEKNVSFAFIISIEDAGNPKSNLKLACIQVVGPDDTYLVQADKDDTKFWASKSQQALGYPFSYKPNVVDDKERKKLTALDAEEWRNTIESGFQISPTSFLGRIQGHDGTKGGVLDGQGIPGFCEFDFSVDPVCGWGNARSTGGWLSHFSVFEPHWQVTMADGNATGRIIWQNKTYDFTNAKFYAEKNWGAALPSKWYWTQCNSFDGSRFQQLSVTAGGGVRGIPFGGKESLGMVCVHYNNAFYEATPWTGEMQWNVTTWGSWELKGKSIYGDRPFEAHVSYQVDPQKNPGLIFRAPTPDEGMVYFCRDTFEAATKLTLWELEWDRNQKQFVRKRGPPLIAGATSSQGGAEVGGGPWWDTWTATSKVSKPVLALLRFPLQVQSLPQRIFRRRQH
mmetsp:Transcript_10391/g.13756  ORF Transcript_10391/g.13756 Transcript_10391/m.13756 type:complete len:492 (-) Transcript_10391:46-1521(-)